MVVFVSVSLFTRSIISRRGRDDSACDSDFLPLWLLVMCPEESTTSCGNFCWRWSVGDEVDKGWLLVWVLLFELFADLSETIPAVGEAGLDDGDD